MNQQENDVLDLLLKELPEFKVHWNKYSDEEIRIGKQIDEVFEPSLYEVASEFSICAIEEYKCDNREFLREAFALIEKMGDHPDTEISNCAMVGFIEGILILRSHEDIALDAFDSYLGTNSRDFWYGMHNFLTGKK